MASCPRCGSELYSEALYEPEYGYGGYTGQEVFSEVEVFCSSDSCDYYRSYGLSELEELAAADAED